jgi:DNA-directed RNA polymerase subunit RPC12/RpoP
VAVHGWNEQEYRKRYGLPWRRGLTSEDSHNRYAAALERRLACGEEGWGATPETQALASKAPRRAQQPYHRLLSLENLTGATAAAQGRAFSKTCPACGRQFEAKGPGRRRCPTCGPWKSQIRPPRIWCCVACGKEFTGNTGHSPRCPECRVIVRRQKSAVRGREWGRAHPERRTAIHKKWAQAHRVHLNEYNRKRRANRESP